MGPIISQEQLDSVMGYIETGKNEGADLRSGGERINSRGFFLEPTEFADVNNSMVIAREEIFGGAARSESRRATPSRPRAPSGPPPARSAPTPGASPLGCTTHLS